MEMKIGVIGQPVKKPNMKALFEQDKLEHPMPSDKAEEICKNLFGKSNTEERHEK